MQGTMQGTTQGTMQGTTQGTMQGTTQGTMQVTTQGIVLHAGNEGTWEWWGPTQGTMQGNAGNLCTWWPGLCREETSPEI